MNHVCPTCNQTISDIVVLPDGRMKTSEAAKYLGFKPSTLHNWRVIGQGPHFKSIHGKIFYEKATLDEWLSEFKPSRSTAQARFRRMEKLDNFVFRIKNSRKR